MWKKRNKSIDDIKEKRPICIVVKCRGGGTTNNEVEKEKKKKKETVIYAKGNIKTLVFLRLKSLPLPHLYHVSLFKLC